MALRREQQRKTLWRDCGAGTAPHFLPELLGVPDTLEGRFTLLSLHLFAVLHRLKTEGTGAAGIVQELVDRFSQDMETVLRELGVSDIRIPKKMRGLAASSMSLLQSYEGAFAKGQSALAEAIEATLPDGTANRRA